MKTLSVLSIAGSDNCAGAGVQADIKTCQANDVYCTTVLTAVTAQNHSGVLSSLYVGDDMLRAQLKATIDAIRPEAVKIGMIPVTSAVEIIAEYIYAHSLKNIVIDTPLTATGGGELTENHDIHLEMMTDHLFPLASIITPNIPEMKRFLATDGLTGEIGIQEVKTWMVRHKVRALLLKGGHGKNDRCTDMLFQHNSDAKEEIISMTEFDGPRINSTNTHGTGCTLSSAIACGLAAGESLRTSVANAKEYVAACIKRAAGSYLFPSNGPLFH